MIEGRQVAQGLRIVLEGLLPQVETDKEARVQEYQHTQHVECELELLT